MQTVLRDLFTCDMLCVVGFLDDESLSGVDERGRRRDEGKTYIYLNRIIYLFVNLYFNKN